MIDRTKFSDLCKSIAGGNVTIGVRADNTLVFRGKRNKLLFTVAFDDIFDADGNRFEMDK